MSPNVQQAVPFFRVSNMEASLRYYVEGLGFRMTRKWLDEGTVRWCWLELGDAALMLQDMRKYRHPAAAAAGTLGAGISICFLCEDALAIYRELRSRGIQASKPSVGNAMWFTSMTDPDGYRLEFESPTEVPEETVLDESDV